VLIKCAAHWATSACPSSFCVRCSGLWLAMANDSFSSTDSLESKKCFQKTDNHVNLFFLDINENLT
jgi:hypothetical protein